MYCSNSKCRLTIDSHWDRDEATAVVRCPRCGTVQRPYPHLPWIEPSRRWRLPSWCRRLPSRRMQIVLACLAIVICLAALMIPARPLLWPSHKAAGERASSRAGVAYEPHEHVEVESMAGESPAGPEPVPPSEPVETTAPPEEQKAEAEQEAETENGSAGHEESAGPDSDEGLPEEPPGGPDDPTSEPEPDERPGESEPEREMEADSGENGEQPVEQGRQAAGADSEGQPGEGDDEGQPAGGGILRPPPVLFSGLPPVRCLDLSPDRRTLATGHRDGSIRLWNLARGADQDQVLPGDGTIPGALKFLPGSELLAALSDRRIELLRMPSGEKTVVIESLADLSSLAFSPDARYLAVGERDGDVVVRSLPHLSVVGRLPGYGGALAVTWCEDRRQFAVASIDNVVRFWTPSGTQLDRPLMAHADWVASMAVLHATRTLVTASWDNTLRAWDLQHLGRQGPVFRGHAARVLAVAASPDGQFLASGSDDGVVKVWDALVGMDLWTIRSHSRAITGLVFVSDRVIVSASDDGSAKAFDLDQGGNLDRWRLPGRGEAAADQLARQQEQYQHLIEKGERTAQQGDHRHAAESFRQAAELRPRYAEPYLKRAECLLELGETAQALVAFRQVVELQPGSGWSYYRLGAALVAAEQHAEAIEYLQRACELLPDLAHARLLLAHSHLSQSEYGRAVHHYKQVLDPLPQAHEAHHGLGLAYARLAAWDLAMESLKKAIEIQRDFGPAYSDLIDTILAGYPHRANEASGWADLARSQGIELRQNTAGRLQETLARGR